LSRIPSRPGESRRPAGRTPPGRRGALSLRTPAGGSPTGSPDLDRQLLSSGHAGFEQVSPAVGELDPAAFSAQMAQDADAALAMLADLAAATDPALRRQARRLAERLLPPLGRAGQPRRRGTRRMIARPGALDGDLDIDRTLERSLGMGVSDPRDVVARQFAAAPRPCACWSTAADR